MNEVEEISEESDVQTEEHDDTETDIVAVDPPVALQKLSGAMTSSKTSISNGRVFLTHGKNQAFLEPLKKIVKLVKLEPVVSVERQTVSKPLPDKVVSDMRSCGSAIIHVDAETILQDAEGKEQIVINPNVLIEIGAALALYGRRFILLVRQGVQLPSNLSGLYEVRYPGDVLDADTTIKLMEALTDVETYAIPDRYQADE